MPRVKLSDLAEMFVGAAALAYPVAVADTSEALKRTIIVTFPAVFSATIVDNLN